MEAITLKKLQKPSDNPFDVARVVINHDILKNIDQYKKNIEFVKPPLEFASHVMDDIFENVLSRARYNAIRADGIRTNSEAHAIATEVHLLKKKLLDYVNSTFYGSYVFAGTKVNNQPFTFTYSELKSYYSFGNIYNTEVLSHNALSGTDSIALQTGDVLAFSIGDKNIYIKALKDMTLEDVVNKINTIAAQKNIPVVATAVNTEDGYKLFIRSGIPSLPPSQVRFGSILGDPQKEYDYPQLVLPEGKKITVKLKNIKTGDTYTISITSEKDMGLADVKSALDNAFKEKGLNADAIIRKTSDGRNYLSLITGDPNLRFTDISDEGERLVPKKDKEGNDINPSSLIINNSSGKIVYLGDYTEREILIDDKRTVKANVVIADEVAKIWDMLSTLEAAITSKAEPFVVTKDFAELDDIVLNAGDKFSFQFDDNTIEIKADSDMTLEDLVTEINKRLTEMGLEAKAELQPLTASKFYLKLSSKNPGKAVSNIRVEDSAGSDKTNSFMGGFSYTTSSSDFISYAIRQIDEIMQSFNRVRERIGTDLEFIEYTEDKLAEKEVNISEETDKLENAKLEETLAQMSRYEAIYQMNLLLLSKRSKLSLLDFMR
jgi:flagellin-like hook-associated protein FlgL